MSWLSILCSAGIFLTTIQAQDFKDLAGDALVGRHTLPLVHPSLARPTLLVALAIWSVALSMLWDLSTRTTIVFNLLGAAVGGRFLLKTGIKADQRSFYLYNVSIVMLDKVEHCRADYFPCRFGCPSPTHCLRTSAFFRVHASCRLCWSGEDNSKTIVGRKRSPPSVMSGFSSIEIIHSIILILSREARILISGFRNYT